MKIVTVNVPEAYITAIERLVGDDENALYPSRSEIIRVAVREFLIKELKRIKNSAKYKTEPEVEVLDEDNFVRVPVEKVKDHEKVREFKTYKIVRKLESAMKPEKNKNKKTRLPSPKLKRKPKNVKPLGNIFHPNYSGPRLM